eukprot:gene1553-938_t
MEACISIPENTVCAGRQWNRIQEPYNHHHTLHRSNDLLIILQPPFTGGRWLIVKAHTLTYTRNTLRNARRSSDGNPSTLTTDELPSHFCWIQLIKMGDKGPRDGEGSESTAEYTPHPPPAVGILKPTSRRREQHSRPSSRPPSAPVHFARVLQAGGPRPASANVELAQPPEALLRAPLLNLSTSESTSQQRGMWGSSSGSQGVPPRREDTQAPHAFSPLGNRKGLSRPSSALSIQSESAGTSGFVLATPPPVDGSGGSGTSFPLFSPPKLQAHAGTEPSATDLLSGAAGISASAVEQAGTLGSVGGMDSVSHALHLLSALANKHPHLRLGGTVSRGPSESVEDISGRLPPPSPPSASPSNRHRHRAGTEAGDEPARTTSPSPAPRSGRGMRGGEEQLGASASAGSDGRTGGRGHAASILVSHGSMDGVHSPVTAMQPKPTNPAAQRFTSKSKAVSPRPGYISPPPELPTPLDSPVSHDTDETKTFTYLKRNPLTVIHQVNTQPTKRERLEIARRKRLPHQLTNRRGKSTWRDPCAVMGRPRRATNPAARRKLSGTSAGRKELLLLLTPHGDHSATSAAQEEAECEPSAGADRCGPSGPLNGSKRNGGDRESSGEITSAPSFSVVAREKKFRQALHSPLPIFAERASKQTNLETKKTLQAIRTTLQRLHASARYQMRQLNQQIDEACKSIRELRADIASKETYHENQRRLKWELHVEQRRRHRLLQLICESKGSVRNYKQDRSMYLQGEVEYCAEHFHCCIFSNKIEASFAGGKLRAHRRLAESLKELNTKADQLTRDISRTKMERRLVLSSAMQRRSRDTERAGVRFASPDDLSGVDEGSLNNGPTGTFFPPNEQKPTTFQAFELVRNAKGSSPDEAWYIEDELRRNEVQERELFRSLEMIQRRVKKKREEVAELESRRRNRNEDMRVTQQRVERQLVRAELPIIPGGVFDRAASGFLSIASGDSADRSAGREYLESRAESAKQKRHHHVSSAKQPQAWEGGQQGSGSLHSRLSHRNLLGVLQLRACACGSGTLAMDEGSRYYHRFRTHRWSQINTKERDGIDLGLSELDMELEWIIHSPKNRLALSLAFLSINERLIYINISQQMPFDDRTKRVAKRVIVVVVVTRWTEKKQEEKKRGAPPHIYDMGLLTFHSHVKEELQSATHALVIRLSLFIRPGTAPSFCFVFVIAYHYEPTQSERNPPPEIFVQYTVILSGRASRLFMIEHLLADPLLQLFCLPATQHCHTNSLPLPTLTVGMAHLLACGFFSLVFQFHNSKAIPSPAAIEWEIESVFSPQVNFQEKNSDSPTPTNQQTKKVNPSRAKLFFVLVVRNQIRMQHGSSGSLDACGAMVAPALLSIFSFHFHPLFACLPHIYTNTRARLKKKEKEEIYIYIIDSHKHCKKNNNEKRDISASKIFHFIEVYSYISFRTVSIAVIPLPKKINDIQKLTIRIRFPSLYSISLTASPHPETKMVLLKAVLPSGKKMKEGHVDPGLQQHIVAVAQASLQHLFYPVVLRYLGRRQRMLITEHYIQEWSLRAIQDAIEGALLRSSLFGLLLAQTGTEVSSSSGGPGVRTGSVSLTSFTSLPALQRSASTPAQKIEAHLQRSVLMLVQNEQRVPIKVVAAGEVLLWAKEPANTVLVILSGSVREIRPVMQDAVLIPASGGSAKTPRSATPQTEAAEGSIPARPPLARKGSGELKSCTTPRSQGPKVRRGDVPFEMQQSVLSAPAVIGETACLSGSLYGSMVVVESEMALVACISRLDYGLLVGECGLPEVQRSLMYEGLREREMLLPFTRPMSVERMRLCPLFHNLREDDLQDLVGQLIPRVYPAGVQMSEGDHPKHIFFIRRGLVRREVDANGYHDVSEVLCERPRNQALLVDGHTFGELPCAFRETTRDAFVAINNVDAYLLPYSTLEELMQLKPEVRVELEKGARELYEQRVMACPGLKFTPTLIDPRLFIDGILPKDCGLLHLYKKVIMDQRLSPSSGPTSRRVTIMDAGTPHDGEKPTLKGGRVTAALSEQVQQVPIIASLTPPSFAVRCLSLWKCVRYSPGEVIVRRGEECNRVLFFYYGSSGVVMNENLYRTDGFSKRSVLPIPRGQFLGFTCVRRHRWMRSVICLEDHTEVWELKRSALVQLLQQFDAANQVNSAVLQVLQPLYPIVPSFSATSREGHTEKRFLTVDLQPLLRPMNNSLWGSQPLPNLHPVSYATNLVQFPVWRAGDFPLGQAEGRSTSFTSRRMSRQVTSSLHLSSGRLGASAGISVPAAAPAAAGLGNVAQPVRGLTVSSSGTPEAPNSTVATAAPSRHAISGADDNQTDPGDWGATLGPSQSATLKKALQEAKEERSTECHGHGIIRVVDFSFLCCQTASAYRTEKAGKRIKREGTAHHHHHHTTPTESHMRSPGRDRAEEVEATSLPLGQKQRAARGSTGRIHKLETQREFVCKLDNAKANNNNNSKTNKQTKRISPTALTRCIE